MTLAMALKLLETPAINKDDMYDAITTLIVERNEALDEIQVLRQEVKELRFELQGLYWRMDSQGARR